jgi:copper chaperone CopZ
MQRRCSMKKESFNMAQKHLCMDCSLALRRFIGGLDGVDSIDVEQGKIVVSFDENEIDREKLKKITTDSIRKLGYDLDEG